MIAPITENSPGEGMLAGGSIVQNEGSMKIHTWLKNLQTTHY